MLPNFWVASFLLIKPLKNSAKLNPIDALRYE